MPKRGFMCKVAFDYELGHALGGTTIYPDVEDLTQHRPCVDNCGIVEVEVSIVRVVKGFSDLSREPRPGSDVKT